MNLRDYIESLRDFAAEHPEYLECDVICSSDDDYNFIVGQEPTPMFHDKDNNYFLDEDSFNEEFDGEDDFFANVICVN